MWCLEIDKFIKPLHIKVSPEDLGKEVIVAGDPGRVKILSELLREPRLVNEYRGYLIYTGYFRDKKMSIASHGIGGASAAILFEELAMLGVRTIVRLGSTGSVREDIDIGDIIVVEGSSYFIGGTIGMYTGASIAYAATPDLELTYVLYNELKRKFGRVYRGIVFSSDSFYAENKEFINRVRELNILSLEMECATLNTVGRLRNIKTACVLVVSDNLIKGSTVLDQLQKLSDRFKEVAEVILEVLYSYSS